MRYLITAFLIACLLPGFAQIHDPVQWHFASKAIDANTWELTFKADIEKKWAIYSQFIDEGGPIPTSFQYDEGSHFSLEGKCTESDNAKTSYDKIFEMDMIKFYGHATFTQKVKVSDPSKPITGYLTFMTCDDQQCLPPKDVDFSFSLSTAPEGSGDGGASAPDAAIENISGIADAEGADGILEPVKWVYRTEKIDEKTYDLVIQASIDAGWHIYSQHVKDGPIPTSIYFNETAGVTFAEAVKEWSARPDAGYDPYFELELLKFKEEAKFTQRITVEGDVESVSGELEFMACDATRCLPPDFKEFTFSLQDGARTGVVAPGINTEGLSVVDHSVPTIKATYKTPLGNCGEDTSTEDKSLLWTFILGFAGGLLALLTPCVFPMIPLTVSFFSKDSKRKGWMNGLIYGISIVVIYVAVGLLVTAFFGETALNALSTDMIANTIFFVIFIAFAFSFFGFYEITLPSSWANKSDSLADKGGLIGIFFMAFTLAIVSFSCTGPIIGSAIVQSATSQLGPFVVMLGFSLALALPFGLFAAFPAWLNSLPRSGSWMNSVKVILGFLELALAFKFLSVADLTSHWGILRYELFLGLWIVIAIAMALYLFGLIKFPHDSPVRKLSIPRLGLAIGMSALALYLMTGFLYNEKTESYKSLPMLSGLAPPAQYNFFLAESQPDTDIKERYSSFSKCANNLDCFKDYYEGVAFAREVNKPILLDFSGYGCVNCRKTEEHIWIKDEIWNRIQEDFVLVSLYVDDRRALDEPLLSKSREEKLRNIGNKWADFQIVNFKQNSQPLYVVISPDEKVLTQPRGYDDSVEDYAEFLECGLKAFSSSRELLGSIE